MISPGPRHRGNATPRPYRSAATVRWDISASLLLLSAFLFVCLFHLRSICLRFCQAGNNFPAFTVAVKIEFSLFWAQRSFLMSVWPTGSAVRYQISHLCSKCDDWPQGPQSIFQWLLSAPLERRWDGLSDASQKSCRGKKIKK